MQDVAATINYQELKHFQEQIGSIQNNDEMAYFSIVVTEQYKNKYLIISAMELTPGSEPQIEISKINFDSESFDQADFSCSSPSITICTIPEKNITIGTYFLRISCEYACVFKLQSFYEELNYMGMQEKRMLILQQNDTTEDTASEVIYINVDKKSLEDPVIDTLIIEFELMNPFQVQHTFNAYFNMIKQGIPRIYDHEAFGIGWGSGAGLGILARQGASQICDVNLVKCNITVLLEGRNGSIISIRSYAYKGIRQVEPFQLAADFATSSGVIKTFELTLDQEKFQINFDNQDLVFSLVQFQGETDIFVHADYLPTELSQYHWNSTSSLGDDKIVITPKERQRVDAKNKKFYISTKSYGWSLFTLQAFPLKKEQLTLGFDYMESGLVLENEIVNYKLNVFSISDSTITVDLHNKFGYSKLYIKHCQSMSYDKCKITLEEIDQYASQSNIFFWSEDIEYQSLTFVSKPSQCQNTSNKQDGEGTIAEDEWSLYCTYAVGVVGKRQQESSYTLKAKHDQMHTFLRENVPQHDVVELGAFNYYKFTLLDDTKIIKIIFEITSLMGEVSMFSSQSLELPSVNHKDKQSFWNTITYSRDENNISGSIISLKGTYFIGVQGDFPLSRYTIRVNLVREDSETVSWYKLMNDIPQEITLDTNYKNRAYFQFTADIDDRANLPKITVTLKISNSSIITSRQVVSMYITSIKEPYPSENNYIWQQNDLGVIQINGQQEASHYSQTGTFYGVIIALNNTTTSGGILKVKVDFSLHNKIKTLKIGEIFETHIQNGTIRHFKFDVTNSSNFTINKKVEAFNQSAVQLYISYDQNNTNPNYLQNNGYLNDEGPLFVQGLTFNYQCQKNTQFSGQRDKYKKCFIYVTVNSSIDTYFLLFADSNSEPVNILGEIQQHISLLRDTHQRHLYYKIQQINDIQIYKSKSTLNRNITLLVKITKLSQNDSQARVNWTYPTLQMYDISIADQYGYESGYTIQSSILEKNNCSDFGNESNEGCILLFLAYSDDQFDSIPTFGSQVEQFTLTIVQQDRKLMEGKSERAKISMHDFQFYSIYVGEDLKNILISLTLLNEGNIKLYANKHGINSSTNGSSIRPTPSSYQWTNNGIDNNILIQKGHGKDSSLKGVYIVAVHCEYGNPTYNIMYTTGNMKFITVTTGMPVDVQIDQSQSIYLIYHNPYINYDFKIIVTKETGNAVIAVNLFDTVLNDYAANLPTTTKYLFSNKDKANTDVLRIQNNLFHMKCQQTQAIPMNLNQKEKEACGFVIGLFSQSKMHLSVVVDSLGLKEIFLPNNKQLRNQLKGTEDINYIILIKDSFNLNFLVIQGSIIVEIQGIASNDTMSLKFSASTIQQKIHIDKKQFTDEELFIIIKNKDFFIESDFLISAIEDKSNPSLMYGVPFSAALYYSEQGVYRVKVNQINSIEFTFQTTSIQLDSTKLNKFIDIQFQGIIDSQGIKQILYPNSHISSQLGIFFELTNITSYSTILVTVKNNFQNKQKLEFVMIVASSKSINLVLPGLVYKGKSHIYESIKAYELFVPKPSILLIDLIECKGSVHLYASTKYEHIINNVFDIQLSKISTQGNKLMIAEIKNQGTIYLGVKTVTDQTVFSFQTRFYDQNEDIPYNQFYLSDDGMIQWKMDENIYEINFQPIKSESSAYNKDNYQVKQIKYQIYNSDLFERIGEVIGCMTKQDLIDHPLNSKNFNIHELVQDSNQQSENLVLKYDKDDLFYNDANSTWIQVVCVVSIYNNVHNTSEEYKYIYKPLEIKNYYIKVNQEHYIWIIIISFVLAIVVILFIMLYLKYNKIKKHLTYEMSDIHKIAEFQDEEYDQKYININQEQSQQHKKLVEEGNQNQKEL